MTRSHRHHAHWRVTLVALAALVAIAGCADTPSSPGEGAGSLYILTTVAGDPVPAVLIVGDYTSHEVVADSILLRADGTGRQVIVTRPTFPDAPAGDPRRVIIRTFTYTRTGHRIAVTLPCDDTPPAPVANACAAPPHYAGTVTPNGITFDVVLGYRAPLEFLRVR